MNVGSDDQYSYDSHVGFNSQYGYDSQDGHNGHNNFCSRLCSKAHLKDLHDCKSLTNDRADKTLQCKEICNGGPKEQW